METKEKQYFNFAENSLWLVTLLLSILSYYKGKSFIIILIFWTINITVLANVRRIRYTGNNLLMLIRMSLYAIHLLLPMLLGYTIDCITFDIKLFFSIITGLFIGIIFILPRYQVWMLYLSYDMIQLSKARKKFDYFAMIMLLIIAPVCEEYFFRYFIITNAKELIGIGSIFLSAVLFWLHHFSVLWSKDSFDKYDYIVQFAFGLTCALVFYFSGNIVPCIAAHLTYNSMKLLIEIRSWVYHYYLINKNR